jgi:hypothetical protein
MVFKLIKGLLTEQKKIDFNKGTTKHWATIYAS